MNNKLFIDRVVLYSFITRDYPLLDELYSKIEADDKFNNKKIKQYLEKYGYKLNIKIRSNKIWVEICPYKFTNNTDNNLFGVTHTEFVSIVIRLESILKAIENLLHIKIDSNINDFKISEIELTQNLTTRYPFPTYIPVWESIRPKYQLNMEKARSTNNFAVIEYPSTVYFKSKQLTNGKNSFTIRIYEKNKHLKDKKIPLIKEYSDLNIMRVELSFNNSNTVKEKLKITTVSDILKDTDFIELNNKRLDILHNYLFHEMLDSEADIVNTLNDIEVANKINAEHQRNKLYLTALIVSTGKIDYKYLNFLFLNNGLTQKNCAKYLKLIKKYKRLHGSNKDKLTVASLYKEIYSKLFGVTEGVQNSA